MEVRHQFAVKVHQMVQDFQKDPTKGHKAAKWAAVFPLAAMDPTQANCQAAFSFLMEFVAVRRWTSSLLCRCKHSFHCKHSCRSARHQCLRLECLHQSQNQSKSSLLLPC